MRIEEGYYHNYFWHYPEVDIVEVVGISLVVFVFLILKMGLFLCHVTNKKKKITIEIVVFYWN